MSKKKPPLTLEELIKRYQHVEFGKGRDVSSLVAVIKQNYRITRQIAERKIATTTKDSPVYPTLCRLRRESLANERKRYASGGNGVEKLRADYDNFIRLVVLMFLLSDDPEYARRVPAAL